MRLLWLVVFALCAQLTFAGNTKVEKSVYKIPVMPMKASGETSATLSKYKGKVLLIVNVASKCGYTKQYTGLEKLYQKYKDQGLVIVGMPSNDFGGQEPGTEQEIVEFCKTTYNVSFPLYAKVETKGEGQAPLYNYLLANSPSNETGEVKWNFEKFLVNRKGEVVGRYRSAVTPEDPALISAIEKELAAN